VVAILQAEPEASAFGTIMASRATAMLTNNVFESEVTILRRHGPERAAEVRLLLEATRTVIHPFDDGLARFATAAYERFGKGRHSAKLNLMDCAAYALAQSLNAPLLYKGEDFSRTDVVSALTAG
jgi:ribonuclease VapC